jgi:hypothetical protein
VGDMFMIEDPTVDVKCRFDYRDVKKKPQNTFT